MDRGLIIKKEWLDCIFDKNKLWEMRSSPTKIRGRIGLIESGSGLIVGEVTIIDCFRPSWSLVRHGRAFHQVKDVKQLEKWPWAWVLRDAKRYDKPIPYSHPQGAVIWVKLNRDEEV